MDSKGTIGTVYLVGAGPGDEGLMTVRGMKLLREADCVIYDRLSSPELLSVVKNQCERIYVGKENHHHTMKQEEINQLLIEKAQCYQRVVRLKGGDVYVFGRGGEEGVALAEAGIPFFVVPGVSSCTAGLAYAGIPITHRGVAGGFRVITAHNQKGELADIDFSSVVHSKDTCVFMMGLSKLSEIVDGLLCAGMAPTMEAAVISKATTPEQRVCVAPLQNLIEKVEQMSMVSPALIVVGNVIKLREALNVFEKRELFGKRYIVLRVGKEENFLPANLRERGASVWEIQTGEIVWKDVKLNAMEMKHVNWFVFTSRHGVDGFFYNLMKSDLDIRHVAQASFAAVGKQTAEALLRYGIRADLVSQVQTGEALADSLASVLSDKEVVVYCKAAVTDQTLELRLRSCCQWKEMVVYENVFPEKRAVLPEELDEYDGIVCTCASSVDRFVKICGTKWNQVRRNTSFFSIGPKTTACLKKHGAIYVKMAREYNYRGLRGIIK